MKAKEGLNIWMRSLMFYNLYNSLRYRIEWLKWVLGRLDRAPHLLKRRIIVRLAREHKAELFIETGTLFGDMVYAMRHTFKRLVSIELDDWLFNRARRRFQRYPHIRILHGDSGRRIVEVLAEVRQNCLFWLDAHYSGGITAHGEAMTPIFDEIRAILNHEIKNHIVVIDDARLFNGTDGYPTFRALRDFVESIDPSRMIWIENDTISIALVSLPYGNPMQT